MAVVICQVGEEGGINCLKTGSVQMRVSGEDVLLCDYHAQMAVELFAAEGANIPVLGRNQHRTLNEQIRRNWEDNVRHAY